MSMIGLGLLGLAYAFFAAHEYHKREHRRQELLHRLYRTEKVGRW